MAAHKTQVERKEFNFESETRLESWQGSFEELDRMIDEIAMGGPSTGDGVYTGATLTRREGGRGTLEMAVRILNGYSWWGFSFSEISKPVKTWLATKITNRDTLDAELVKLDLWEKQKDLGDSGMRNYKEFKYDSTNTLQEPTLTLAKKIIQGVESYSVYTPVATCHRTQNEPFTDGLNSIGKYVTRLESPTEQVPANAGQLAAIAGMRSFWLKTSDEITQNSDGTLSRTETWTGYDTIDVDLYERA